MLNICFFKAQVNIFHLGVLTYSQLVFNDSALHHMDKFSLQDQAKRKNNTSCDKNHRKCLRVFRKGKNKVNSSSQTDSSKKNIECNTYNHRERSHRSALEQGR